MHHLGHAVEQLQLARHHPPLRRSAAAVAASRRGHGRTPAGTWSARRAPRPGRAPLRLRGGLVRADLDLDRHASRAARTSLDRRATPPVDPPARQREQQIARRLDVELREAPARSSGRRPSQRLEPGEQREQDLRAARSWRSPISASQPSSSMVSMPSSAAFFAFDPAPGPGDQQIGLRRDRARHLGPQRLGPRLGLGPGHLFQRAGEDHGLARDRAVGGAARASAARRRAAPPAGRSRRVRPPGGSAVTSDVAIAAPTPSMLTARPTPAPSAGRRPAVIAASNAPRCRSARPEAWPQLSPTWRMPSAKISRFSGILRRSSIAANRLPADFSPQPSRFFSCCRPCRSRVAARVKMSAGSRIAAVGVELLDLFRAQPLDVEGRAARRNASASQPPAPGRSARRCSGAPRRPPRAPPRSRIRGQVSGKTKGTRVGGPLGQIHIGDLRDHVAGAVDLHPVADADVLAAADRRALARRARRCNPRCAASRSTPPRRPPSPASAAPPG